jgi:hypothetical protein
MWSAFSKLLKDAAERHNTTMITPDFSGWFFVISSHGEELKRQQIGQLPHLVWFTQEPVLQAAMKQGGLGSNAAGTVLPAGKALAAAKHAAGSAAGAEQRNAQDSVASGDASSKVKRSSASSSASSSSEGSVDMQQYQVPGKPFEGLMLQLGGSSSSGSKRSSSSKGAKQQPAASAGSKELQLHVAAVQMLEDLLAGARYSHAAYGYVAAAGHMSSIGNALKLLATLPLFDPITGESFERVEPCVIPKRQWFVMCARVVSACSNTSLHVHVASVSALCVSTC